MMETQNVTVFQDKNRSLERSLGVMTERKERRNPDSDLQRTHDTRFQDVLKQVSEREQKPSSDPGRREVTAQDIRERMDAMEDKLDTLSPAEQKSRQKDIQTVRETLDAVRKFLEKIEAGQGGEGSQKTVRIEFGQTSMDFSFFLNNILGLIADLFNRGKSSELQTLLGYLNGKLGETSSLMDALSGAPAQTPSADKAAADTPGKVKIVDLRGSKDASPSDAAQAGAKSRMSKMTSGETSQMTAARTVEQAETLLTKKTADLIPETGRVREMPNPQILAAGRDPVQQAAQKMAAGTAANVSRAQMEALFQNIAGRMSLTLRNGQSEFKMSLTPPELGFMRMKFTLEDGQLAGKVVVSTPEAKALFDQNLGDLQRALQQAGIHLGQMDITYSQDQDGSDARETGDRSILGSILQGEGEDLSLLDGGEVYDRHSLYDSRINFIA